MKNIFTKTSLALSLLLSLPAVAASVTGTTQLPNSDNVATESPTSISCMFGSDLLNIYSQFNSFRSPTIVVNPQNSKNYVVVSARDGFLDTSATPLYFPILADGIVNFSVDGGSTWGISFPQSTNCIVNGGTISQSVAPFTFPLSFSNNGTLYYAAVGSQTQPNATEAQNLIFVQTSKDGGASWSAPVIVDQTISNAFNSFTTPCQDGPADCSNTCFANGPGAVLADPLHDCTVHLSWSNVTESDLNGLFTAATFSANIQYSRSTDGAKTFSPAKLVYDASLDPEFRKEHGNPNFNLPCFVACESISPSLVSVPSKKHKHKQTLLIGFQREYPRLFTLQAPIVPVTPANYDETPNTSYFDHAVIRSCDDGKTWTKVAAELPQYIFATSHDPRLTGTFELVVTDGALNQPMAVSPKTNRVYMIYQAGNTDISTDPTINQFYPDIEISASYNKGKTWTQNRVVVSRTQYIPGIANPNNQSFNCNIVVLPNGLVGIIYTDYRYFMPQTPNTGPVATDVWLALYRETESKTGGSTGIGLDYTNIEVRLTQSGSFDASVALAPLTGQTIPFGSPGLSSIGLGTGIAARGCSFLTTYGATTNNQNLAAIITTPASDGIQDFNNRMNIIFEQVTP